MIQHFVSPGPIFIKLFSCSIQLSMKFERLIKTKMLKYRYYSWFKLSYTVSILLLNVKMPTTVGILTFISWIKTVLLSMKQCL